MVSFLVNGALQSLTRSFEQVLCRKMNAICYLNAAEINLPNSPPNAA